MTSSLSTNPQHARRCSDLKCGTHTHAFEPACHAHGIYSTQPGLTRTGHTASPAAQSEAVSLLCFQHSSAQAGLTDRKMQQHHTGGCIPEGKHSQSCQTATHTSTGALVTAFVVTVATIQHFCDRWPLWRAVRIEEKCYAVICWYLYMLIILRNFQSSPNYTKMATYRNASRAQDAPCAHTNTQARITSQITQSGSTPPEAIHHHQTKTA